MHPRAIIVIPNNALWNNGILFCFIFIFVCGRSVEYEETMLPTQQRSAKKPSHEKMISVFIQALIEKCQHKLTNQ